MMHIRMAVAADVPSLLPLVAAFWEFEGISGVEEQSVACQRERLLSEPRLGAGWIALNGNLPIGYLLAVYVFSLEHLGLTAEIDEFFVSPASREAMRLHVPSTIVTATASDLSMSCSTSYCPPSSKADAADAIKCHAIRFRTLPAIFRRG